MASNLAQATTDVNRLRELVAFFNKIVLGDADMDATIDGETRPVLAKLAASFLLGMDTYASVDEGLDETGEGGFFQVVSDVDEEYTILYQDVNGEAVEKKRYPSWQMVALIFQARDEAEAAATSAEQDANQAESSANQAATDAADARAASEASGNILFYDSYADADAATLDEGQIVHVFTDETRAGRQSRYRYEAGALVFKTHPNEYGRMSSPISWHGQTIDEDMTIPPNMNAWSFGPNLTIADGTTVTVGTDSSWTIANGEIQ